MIENKIVYLNSLLKDQREIPKIVSKDPLLKQISQEKADEYVNNLECNFMTILSENYPNSLKILPNPPWIIYYKGNIGLLKKVLVGIIGTSSPSMYGLKATADVIRVIKKEKALLCECKKGICKQAIMSATANEISIVSISNCVDDFKSDFIKRVTDKNLVITTNLNKKFDQSWFDNVQMILSNEIIVIEGNEKSSCIDKIKIAINNGLNIYALPGNIYEQNSYITNVLINDGAKVIYLGVEI